MALVRTMAAITKRRQSVHGEVECGYSVFTDVKGLKYLQLETLGSPTRKLTGKPSQCLQFDQAALRELRRIIDQVLS